MMMATTGGSASFPATLGAVHHDFDNYSCHWRRQCYASLSIFAVSSMRQSISANLVVISAGMGRSR